MVREYNMEHGVEDLENLEVLEVAEEDTMDEREDGSGDRDNNADKMDFDEQEERNSENDVNSVPFNIPQYNQQNQHNQQFAPFPRSVSRVAYDLIVGGAPEDAMVDLVDLEVLGVLLKVADKMAKSKDGNGSDGMDVDGPEGKSCGNGGEGEGFFGHTSNVHSNIPQYNQYNQHLVPSQEVFQESRRL